MRAYHRPPQERDRIQMDVLLFLGEDLDSVYGPEKDCIVVKRGGEYSFDWGLHEHGELHMQICFIRDGKPEQTNYRKIKVDGDLAREVIRLGEKYRAKWQGSDERVTIHNSHLFNKPVPQEFQDKAKELYESAGLIYIPE